MWTKEVIFSKGDLSNNEEYKYFLTENYQGNHHERLIHVTQMIDRLQAEKTLLLGEEK